MIKSIKFLGFKMLLHWVEVILEAEGDVVVVLVGVGALWYLADIILVRMVFLDRYASLSC